MRLAPLVFVLLTGLFGTFFVAACDDAACDAALDKLRSCAAQVDCNNADPRDRTRCLNNKKAAEDAANRLDGVPCVAEIADLAEQVNQCNPRPGDFCECSF
jgi:hypothetical protein